MTAFLDPRRWPQFGEIGIDNELVVNADEEVFEMNNGCICCTVRGQEAGMAVRLT